MANRRITQRGCSVPISWNIRGSNRTRDTGDRSGTRPNLIWWFPSFGPVSARNNNRIWFRLGSSRIGLLKTPDGERPGVNHFCVSAEPFNYDAVVARLAALGAKIEPQELPGSPSFRDPDGMLVQVSPVG